MAICTYQRKEIQQLIEKQMDSYNIVARDPICSSLLKVVLDCKYDQFIPSIQEAKKFFDHHFYLHRFSECLVDLFKAKIYEQYLRTYDQVQYVQMANDLKVEPERLQAELEYFVFTKQVKARMTPTSLKRQQQDACDELFLKFYDGCTKLIN